MTLKYLMFVISVFSCFSLFLTGNAAGAKKDQLRFALLPIPSVLPIYVAEKNGYFKELGLTVETLPVGSALERDQLMQAGRIDGMINEISGAVFSLWGWCRPVS